MIAFAVIMGANQKRRSTERPGSCSALKDFQLGRRQRNENAITKPDAVETNWIHYRRAVAAATGRRFKFSRPDYKLDRLKRSSLRAGLARSFSQMGADRSTDHVGGQVPSSRRPGIRLPSKLRKIFGWSARLDRLKRSSLRVACEDSNRVARLTAEVISRSINLWKPREELDRFKRSSPNDCFSPARSRSSDCLEIPYPPPFPGS